MTKISFIGSGSYGTAVAHHVAEKYAEQADTEVIIYGRDNDIIDEINQEHTNNKYLNSAPLSKNLKATSSLEEAAREADHLFISVPAQQVRKVIQGCKSYIPQKTKLTNLAKGIEVDSLKRMSQVIYEETKTSKNQILTLSGPSFARDIVNPNGSVALTLGGSSENYIEEVRDLLHTTDFQVFGSDDLVGVEFGGALKNVYAIMAGIMKGSGAGDSYLGSYIPRATVEIDTISRFFGAHRDAARGLSGAGDLIITCSEASRNFRFGRCYAECFQEAQCGEKAIEMANERLGHKTVEGYHTLKAIHQFVTDHNMFAPIVRELNDILYHPKESGKSPKDAITSFREQDGIRKWEKRPLISRMLGRVMPHLWYRRESFSISDIKEELSARVV